MDITAWTWKCTVENLIRKGNKEIEDKSEICGLTGHTKLKSTKVCLNDHGIKLSFCIK